MDNELLIEKKSRKRKKYKHMKILLGVVSTICILLLDACIFATVSIFNLNGQISDLTGQTKTANAQIDSLNSEILDLNEKYVDLENEKKDLASEKESLITTNESLLQELEALRNDLNGSGQSIADLEALIEKKDASIANLESKVKSLSSNVSKLESQIKDLKAQLSSTESSDPEEDEPENEEPKPSVNKTAYLTFDDGISDQTTKILDILKQYNVKATFFVNFAYKKINGYKEIYQRIVDEGHTLANHTSTHDFDSVYSSVDGFEKEVMAIHNSIKEITGYEMTLFRFPGGSNTTYVKKLGTAPHTRIHELGYEYYDWNVDSGDATAHNVPTDTIIKNVLNGAKYYNNAIVLMHDLGSKYKRTTVEALPDIIEGLKDMGFTLKAMDESVPAVQFTKDPNR